MTPPKELKREYRRSVVDALMLELAENDPGVRGQVTVVLARLGEEGCVALCAEVRDIEDDGGLWIVETRQRRTKGGVWFAVLKSRYAWARFAMPHQRRSARKEESDGVAPRLVQAEGGRACEAAGEDSEVRPKGGTQEGTGSGPPPEDPRAARAAPALTPPLTPEPVSPVRPRARQASLGSPEVIVFRRRGGAL